MYVRVLSILVFIFVYVYFCVEFLNHESNGLIAVIFIAFGVNLALEAYLFYALLMYRKYTAQYSPVSHN